MYTILNAILRTGEIIHNRRQCNNIIRTISIDKITTLQKENQPLTHGHKITIHTNCVGHHKAY